MKMADTMGCYTPPQYRGRIADVYTPQQYCGQIADFLVANPGAWLQGALAADAMGYRGIDPDHPEARKWCSVGLLDKFIADVEMNRRASNLVRKVIAPIESIVFFNDMQGRTINDVIQMFRCASYMLESEQLVAERKAAAESPEESLGMKYAKALSKAMTDSFVQQFKGDVAKHFLPVKPPEVWKPLAKDEIPIPDWNVLAHAPPIIDPALISQESWYIKQSVALLKTAA
jgi:hypothetical protein